MDRERPSGTADTEDSGCLQWKHIGHRLEVSLEGPFVTAGSGPQGIVFDRLEPPQAELVCVL